MTDEQRDANEPRKQRVEIENLPQPAQELTPDEQQQVKGGSRYAYVSLDRKEEPQP